MVQQPVREKLLTHYIVRQCSKEVFVKLCYNSCGARVCFFIYLDRNLPRERHIWHSQMLQSHCQFLREKDIWQPSRPKHLNITHLKKTKQKKPHSVLQAARCAKTAPTRSHVDKLGRTRADKCPRTLTVLTQFRKTCSKWLKVCQKKRENKER